MCYNVYNMVSPQTGRPVANQFVIDEGNKKVFKSYDSFIAVISNDGIVTLDPNFWDYSKTTVKYLCAFLGVSCKKDIETNIKSGVYRLQRFNV